MSAKHQNRTYTVVLVSVIITCLVIPGLVFVWQNVSSRSEDDIPTRSPMSERLLFGPTTLGSSALGSSALGSFTGPSTPRASVRSHLDPSSLRSFQVDPAVRIDSGGTSAAAEVSMVANGDEVVAAWIDLRSGTDRARVAVAVSQDFGLTWSDQLLQPTGDPNSNDLHGDPITAHDPRTGQLWAGGLAFFDHSLFVARYLTGTSNLTSPVTFGTDLIVDKPWLAAGSPPAAPNTTRLYAIDAVGDLFISDDLGLTWNVAGSTQQGTGHLPRVGPNGELYVAYRDALDTACLLQHSDDGGQTFGPAKPIGAFDNLFLGPLIPGQFRVPSFCILAVDPTDGTLFQVAADVVNSGEQSIDVLLVRSDDQGDTWTTPQVVSGGTPTSDQFLPWLEIDTSGRLHMVYLDTRRVEQDKDDPDAWLDVYYSTSEDRGQSWTEVPLTEQAFNTSSSSWLNNIEQFVGDYLGLAISDGRAIVSYAATHNGDLDIYAQRILFAPNQVFNDGFESGDTNVWSSHSP